MPCHPETLARHCAPIRSEPYAPPTVESIREGERRLSAIGDAPLGAWSSQVPQPAADSEQGAAGDDSDFAELERPIPGLRASLVIAVWQLMPKTTSGRVLLVLLAVPALVGVVALVAMVWPR